MRQWRKLHQEIITSERLSKVNDSARWLFALLVVAQDDEGKYPWTSSRVNALTAATGWDRVGTDSALNQLCESGVTVLKDGFVYLVHGAEKNGVPANARKWPFHYPALSRASRDRDSESAPSRLRVGTESAPTSRSDLIRSDLIRSDKSRGVLPSFIPPHNKATPLSQEETGKLIALHTPYWSEQEVRDRIEEALSHSASKKYKSTYLYVRGWLRRDAEKSREARDHRGNGGDDAAHIEGDWRDKPNEWAENEKRSHERHPERYIDQPS